MEAEVLGTLLLTGAAPLSRMIPPTLQTHIGWFPPAQSPSPSMPVLLPIGGASGPSSWTGSVIGIEVFPPDDDHDQRRPILPTD